MDNTQQLAGSRRAWAIIMSVVFVVATVYAVGITTILYSFIRGLHG